jgi:lysophospholipase L1-like esterase
MKKRHSNSKILFLGQVFLVLLLAIYIVDVSAYALVKAWGRRKLLHSYETVLQEWCPYYRPGFEKYVDIGRDVNNLKFFSPSILLGYRLSKNFKGREGLSLFFTNAQGFGWSGPKSETYPLIKKDGSFRIMLLGGSTMFGVGVFPHQNIPAFVSFFLNQHSKKHYEVINAGVPGYHSGQEFLYLTSDLLDYNPDLLIAYNGCNDLLMLGTMLENSGRTKNSFRGKGYESIQKHLTDGYTFLGSLGHAIDAVFFQFPFLIDVKERLRPPPAKPGMKVCYSPEIVELYAQNLNLILAQAKFRKIKLALFLQPIEGSGPLPESVQNQVIGLPERQKFYKDARALFANLAKKYANDPNVVIEDISQILNNRKKPYLDGIHTTAQSNKVIAEEILRRINLKGLLPAE